MIFHQTVKRLNLGKFVEKERISIFLVEEKNITKGYPSATLALFLNVEKRLEKERCDLNGFKNSIKKIQEKITYFKGEKIEGKKFKIKTLSSLIKSTFTTVRTTTNSTSFSLST